MGKETLIQYKSIEPCNFNNDLNFWIEYIEYVDKRFLLSIQILLMTKILMCFMSCLINQNQ